MDRQINAVPAPQSSHAAPPLPAFIPTTPDQVYLHQCLNQAYETFHQAYATLPLLYQQLASTPSYHDRVAIVNQLEQHVAYISQQGHLLHQYSEAASRMGIIDVPCAIPEGMNMMRMGVGGGGGVDGGMGGVVPPLPPPGTTGGGKSRIQIIGVIEGGAGGVDPRIAPAPAPAPTAAIPTTHQATAPPPPPRKKSSRPVLIGVMGDPDR